jgi:hypothetical protein
MFRLVKIESSVRPFTIPAAADQPEKKGSVTRGKAEAENQKHAIFMIRGQRVMLDEDAAVLYGVEMKELNDKVRKNKMRFPGKYMFQLKDAEYDSLRPQSEALKMSERRKNPPHVFTERGIIMLSLVLDSYKALEMNFDITEDFISVIKQEEESQSGQEAVSNSVNSVLGRMIGTGKKKYGFGAAENNKVQEAGYVAVYGQQH